MIHASRVAWLTDKRTLEFREEALDDTALAPTQILCRTLYSCVSPGTEIAAYSGLPPLRPMRLYPRVVGYCNVAEVLKVGGESGCAAGDVVYTHQSHRSHFICEASQVVVPLDKGLSRETLIAISPMYLYHLSYNALLSANFMPGMRVAVIGLGCLGLTAAQLLSIFSATWAGLTRRDAKQFADLNGPLGDVCSFENATPDSFDITLVTSNSWRDWQAALKLPRVGGTIACLGFPGRGEAAPDFNPLDSQFTYDKQLRILFCAGAPNRDVQPWEIRFTLKRNCRYLIDLIRSGALKTSRLISTVVPSRDLGKVYVAMAERKEGIVTAVLDWNAA